MTRSTIGIVLCIVAGAALGAAAWYVREEPRRIADTHAAAEVATHEPDRTAYVGGGGTHASPVATPSTNVGASSREAPPRLDPQRDERDEPRDPSWAAPMERLFDDVAATRVRQLVPEVNWVGVECRSRGCTMDIDCPGDSGDVCQMLANILVVVDGMRLHIRQQPSATNGRFHVLVDIELPDGDAAALRSSIEREQELHPEYVERLSEAIAMSRRERDAAP